jgi:uncharacterized protein (TIGR02246 family)
MKKIIATTVLITMFSATVFAQTTKAGQEVLKVNADYDKATLNGDASFFKKVLAPEFITYGPDGSFRNRAEVLKRMEKEKAAPTYKLTALSSDDVKVKMAGNLAVVTGQWKSTTTTMENEATPHNDEGRYTAIYEKRNGQWLLITDHATEKTHTATELEPALKKASDDYDKALKTKDAGLFERLLTEDYESTNETGQVRNKKDDIANMTSPDLVFSSIKSEDKKFRIYRNAAVETGSYSAEGTYKGKAFSEKGRYTSTWIYKDGKWQMVADHTSVMPVKSDQ